MKKRNPEGMPKAEHKDIAFFTIETAWGPEEAAKALVEGTQLECIVVTDKKQRIVKKVTPLHVHREYGGFVIDVISENGVSGVITLGSDGTKILEYSYKKKGKS